MIILTLQSERELNLPFIDLIEIRPERCGKLVLDRPFLATGFLSNEASYIDIPYGVEIEPIAKAYPNAKLIHSFHGDPDSIADLYAKMDVKEVAFVKIVLRESSLSNYLKWIPFLQKSNRRLALFIEGERGRATRLLSYMFGAPLIYTSTDGFKGQIPYQELRDLFPLDSLGLNTKILAILLGSNAKSFGATLYNRLYKEAGLDAIYLPLVIEEEEIEAVIGSPLFYGLAITMPFKRKVYSLLGSSIDSSSVHCKAINTYFQGIGYNSDRYAIDLLEPVKGKKVAILGRGGMARALGYELRLRGAHPTLYSRQESPLEGLECRAIEDIPEVYDILIDASPYSGQLKRIDPKAIVMDVKIEVDPLYLSAQRLIGGIEVFIRQAMEQNRIFGLDPLLPHLVNEYRRQETQLLLKRKKKFPYSQINFEAFL